MYDEYRTARLNIKYLQCQLKILKRYNSIIECIIALTASSSVAGLWFWNSVLGGYIWKIIGSITAVLAVIKPLLKLPEKTSKTEELLVGYKALHFDLENLVYLIKQRQIYDDSLQTQFLQVLERKKELTQKNNDPVINRKLSKKCFEQVNTELPANQFYVPRSDFNVRKKPTKSTTTTTSNS